MPNYPIKSGIPETSSVEASDSAPTFPALRSRISRWLHGLAGITLLLFAASHVGFLLIRSLDHELQSTVFPFFTNREVYLAAAFLEAGTALFCFRNRGKGVTNVLIFSFVGLMLWYRWAFSVTGGRHCGCLGLLGILLHVNKFQEKAIPVLALALLLLTTALGSFCFLQKFFGRLLRSLPAVCILFACHSSPGVQAVRIDGVLRLQEYNPRTARPYADQRVHSVFDVVISDSAWKLSVTNVDWPKWNVACIYDGTNCYTILPFRNACWVPFGPKPRPSTNDQTGEQWVEIEPSPRLLLRSSENLGISMVWFTYGLSPRWVKSNRQGLVEVPMPSGAPRVNPAAFGYKWLIKPLEDGRFASYCDIIRDRSLDLPDKQELLRQDTDYPESLPVYNQYRANLFGRIDLPSGFLKARYRCLASLQTNGIAVPTMSRYEVYLNPSENTYPWRVVELQGTSVKLIPVDSESLLPPVDSPTRVIDYRYKIADKHRIFKYAQYSLKPGQSWRSGQDPELVEIAHKWLKNGPKYTDFSWRGTFWATWLLLGLIAAPLFALFFIRWKRTVQDIKNAKHQNIKERV